MSRSTAIIILLLLIPFHLLWMGFVLSKLWGWFLVPVGLAVPALPIVIGAYILFRVVVYFAPKEDFCGDVDLAFKRAASAFVNPAMYLGIGWIVSAFV